MIRTVVLVLSLLVCATRVQAQVQSPGRFGVSVEGLSLVQQRNDVRIPPSTGTEFSIVDLIGAAPTPSVRVEATVNVSERQELRFVYAPVRFTGTGTPSVPIAFAGSSFAAVPTEAEYQFSSYRGTWRFRVYQVSTWTWQVGFTGFVRDARIALSQAGRTAENSDVGFVPLGHVRGSARISDRWNAALELDVTAAPQGRALDLGATVDYRPAPRVTLSAGYRTVEGGADVDSVYAFAWLNAAVARLGVRF